MAKRFHLDASFFNLMPKKVFSSLLTAVSAVCCVSKASAAALSASVPAARSKLLSLSYIILIKIELFNIYSINISILPPGVLGFWGFGVLGSLKHVRPPCKGLASVFFRFLIRSPHHTVNLAFEFIISI